MSLPQVSKFEARPSGPARLTTNRQPPPKRFRILTEDEIENLPDPTWVVEGILPAKSLAILYGQSGVGKTFLALSLALSVANGIPWHGRPTAAGTVVYVAAEGESGIKMRFGAWKQAHGIERVQRVYFVPEPVRLHKEEEVQAFLQQLTEVIKEPIALIVFDTMARCFVGGEENSAKDMGALVDGIGLIQKGTGAAALLLHHTTWTGEHERGSSALRGAADTMLGLSASKGSLELACAKQKDAEPFEPIGLGLRRHGDSCVLEAADPKAAGKSANCLHILSAYPDGLTATEWLRATGLPETTFYRRRKELEREDLVRKEGDRYVLTERGAVAVTASPALGSVGQET